MKLIEKVLYLTNIFCDYISNNLEIPSNIFPDFRSFMFVGNVIGEGMFSYIDAFDSFENLIDDLVFHKTYFDSIGQSDAGALISELIFLLQNHAVLNDPFTNNNDIITVTTDKIDKILVKNLDQIYSVIYSKVFQAGY